MIEVRDLVKQYGRHTAVDHLSFTVEPGQVYGFLGPNGAGKSTTMNMMTGYLGASGGEVLVDGHSMAADSQAARKLIGYLPEQPPLYTDMTVWEYLSFVAALKGVKKKAAGAQVEGVMARVRLTDVEGRLIRNLSKGYRQRVGLAQALLGDPRYIILDEPTVGLDPKQIIEIRALIRDLAKEHTVILSSHILAEVQAVCDQILIIHHGRMVASGTPGDLERELAGSNALELVIKGDGPRAAALLEAIPGAERVVFVPGAEEGACALRLESAGGADLREAVFRACAGADMPLLTMKSGGLTLEEVFLKLTADDTVEEETLPMEEDAEQEDEA